MKLSKHADCMQIRALLKKDYLVRIRQPWMTLIQYLWPCMIFAALYILRNRFQAVEINDCQFPTRNLQANGILPLFQSYICTFENECQDPKSYAETEDFNDAPVTPVVNIVQIILDNKPLYDAIVELPIDRNFISTVTTIVTHPKFKEIERNGDRLVKMLPEIRNKIGGSFDILQLFSDDQTFSKSGNILCGRPFPRSDNIRFVDNILYTPDYAGADKDELDVMPTPYCKQLYLDVTNTNNGKITWRFLKPILQGKILYGPTNERNDEIMNLANQTFDDMGRLGELFRALDTTLQLLRTDEEVQDSFQGLIDLAKSPLVQMIAGGNVNIELIESMLNGILHDEEVAKAVNTIANIFDCFAADRFIPVADESALEDRAFELNRKKLFFAGVFFENGTTENEITYKIRMRTDDTPVTVENRNRFWFPGPESSFELDMRYHRGFIQIQHAVDMGIIRQRKKAMFTKERKEGNDDSSSNDGELELDDELDQEDDQDDADDKSAEIGSNEELDGTTTPSAAVSAETTTENLTSVFADLSKRLNLPQDVLDRFGGGSNNSALEDFLNFNDDEEEDTNSDASTTTTIIPVLQRRKRQSFLDLLFGGKNKASKDEVEYKVANEKFYTKQFPYPKYTKDDFKKGIYLAQAIQMTYFIALIVHVASAVRQKIWMKESGNSMLMRSMGLKSGSETVSWIITTFIEICIVFLLGLIILYGGGILAYSSQIFLFCYMVVFGICLIGFCYMCSMFFSSASIGSVSSVILFLITFLPYIIIISLGATLSTVGKFIANLSFSTAFCYAWRHVMRMELQHRGANFSRAFQGAIADNDLKFGILMILLDAVIYFTLGYLYQCFKKDETTFHTVKRIKLDKSIGADLRNVDVTYEKGGKKVLSDVSITFRRDEVTCLLGRNGAGKSTIIKLLTGQVLPIEGDVHLPLDYDFISGIRNNAEKIGLCPQNDVLIPNLTAKEHLQLYARIKLTRGFGTEVSRTLDNLKMGPYQHYRASDLSGGFKRRLCIAIAFLGSPNLVILDEPCSSVDTKARKYIWELIQTLRKDRAVILATHHLDEAECLSDKIVVLENGKAILEQSQEELKKRFTNTIYLRVLLRQQADTDRTAMIAQLSKLLDGTVDLRYEMSATLNQLDFKISSSTSDSQVLNIELLLEHMAQLKSTKQIESFEIRNENLLNIFNTVNASDPTSADPMLVNGNGNTSSHIPNGFHGPKTNDSQLGTLSIMYTLFRKRTRHFMRNYRLLVCLLVLPTIFEIIAMGFMTIRPPGDHDQMVNFSTALYPKSAEFYTNTTDGDEYRDAIVTDLLAHCTDGLCSVFNSSLDAYRWILSTTDDYAERRYGGITVNKEKNIVWYNNKGYHSMPTWLNMLDTAVLRAELDDPSYTIRTINHPLKIEEDDLSISSMLQQIADAGISLIMLLAFSLVVAGASVYIVSERIRGEKLQQRLAGVNVFTYWTVTYIWDAMIFLIAVALAVIVFKAFALPAYVARQQLEGIVLLLVFYGFATIPGVHLFEKLFTDASFANMSLFCLNVITALGTLTIILMFDILGDSDQSEKIRNFLNRAFLVLPQHALSDGLIELSKNYITAEIFKRYYIDSYKSPIDLLRPHIIALVVMGLIFMLMNVAIEYKLIQRAFQRIAGVSHPKAHELNGIDTTDYSAISHSISRVDGKKKSITADQILSVDNLRKKYRVCGGGGGGAKGQEVVKDVSFKLHYGECFGLLGTNGAGKSTIFAILSGELLPSGGSFTFYSNHGPSYCPQNNFLDPLLTVEEVILFYGKLRNIESIDKLVMETLKEYHLEAYRKVLVKNLSGGNRRKLCVAVACFGQSEIILMDEPTSDLDPVTRSIVYSTIERLNAQNRSILLTSHSISEIDRICQRIAILKDGELLTVDTPERLKERFGHSYQITLYLEGIREVDFLRVIKREFDVTRDILLHKNSVQFVCQICPEVSVQENGKPHKNGHVTIMLNESGNGVVAPGSTTTATHTASELFLKLQRFAQANKLRYTISRCQMDQIFENVLQTHEEDHANPGFVDS
ncbi:ATP-binding cassette sub-family A member 13 [Anopheles funestus]|uniref:ATP-binding cassette sub-family A member 13 n=1 Tax=Anopheles funestus TaxID=62324 RepID=UPI0020C73ACE|nr:ATP-binding cassette sub-family A member 13 [Anopheles funestus]XP_049289466.1 ATP-binding cassette sub-family A member 13 [Anopheles funestus]XP_049289467.1 ATP-binding cassette sub-family A member 13 [Anopheles funestus]XP_049289468.1 ATP-binding cassette sub-family A member 13 [Anopheles funestus]XP_049289469.1 ATP-binding cassette sub-family A member 13 [Anopheles funestus]XP_049289470.1 ATP-binding cassette sub-family A member 13 [Anopheles funestus]